MFSINMTKMPCKYGGQASVNKAAVTFLRYVYFKGRRFCGLGVFLGSKGVTNCMT